MKLHHLTIDNFKGITHFELDAAGKNIDIYGDNATGKTTIADAITWLLFDKDTDGRKSFSIKPLASDGTTAIQGVEVSVAGIFIDCGRTTELKKIYREVWERRRGSAVSEMSGHTTDYYIDDVPTAATAYKGFIDSIVPTAFVPVLSDPMYFARSLPWKERRTILLEIAGIVSDEDAAAESEAFAAFLLESDGRTIDETVQHWTANRRKANEELANIPPRIDELSNMLAVEPDDPDMLAVTADSYRRKIERLKSPKKSVDATDLHIAEMAHAKIRDELNTFVAAENDLMTAERDAVRARIEPLRVELKSAEESLAITEKERTRAEMTAALQSEIMDRCRNAWNDVSSREWDGDMICPTCKQPMPPDTVAESRARYEEQKNAELDELQSQGLAAKDKKEKAEKELAELEIESTRTKKVILDLREKIDASYSEPEHSKGYDQKVAKLKANVEAAQNVIDDINTAQTMTRREAAEAIADAEQQLADIERQLRVPEQNTRLRTRIDELNERRRELGDMLAKADNMIVTAEEFARAKCRMTQDRINALFSTVTWRLWKDQINGGMQDCCDALIGGVPFEDANNAAKINAGIEIISVLSEHYGKDLPVLIDNAEAVTQLAATDLQTIRLVVSESDKALRVERNSYDSNTQKKNRNTAA